MKLTLSLIVLITITFSCGRSQQTNITDKNMKFNILNKEEQRVILGKGTEHPFTGKFEHYEKKGTYLCKRCNSPLYYSNSKFDAQCGWPAFDDEIPGAVIRKTDADGSRTEILCAHCGAHLGHVFLNEGFTDKNVRHCVNSISLNFIPVVVDKNQKLERAIFAAGCFWGVEHYLKKEKGVISTTVGYIGGNKVNPTYEQVCSHTTGHAEAVEVYFNPDIISYETLAKLFFEIHDPTQINRQGPDIGDQYRSEIFYLTLKQKEIAQKLIAILEQKGLKVATKLAQATDFFPAESYHQDYYDKKGGSPYCHFRTKRF